MQIKNVRGRTLEIAATSQRVAPGEVVEVSDDLGESLCEQPANWQKAEPQATETPTPTPRSKPSPADDVKPKKESSK